MNIDRWRQMAFAVAAFFAALAATFPDDQFYVRWAGIASAVAIAVKAFEADPNKKDKP